MVGIGKKVGPPGPTTKAQASSTVGASEQAKEPHASSPAGGFDGVNSDPVHKPVAPEPGKGALAVQLGDNDVAPERALALQIVPPSATKADLSGVISVEEAMGKASDGELMQLIRDRFTALQADAFADGAPPRLELGTQFVDIGRLVPGQTRIAIDRVQEKVALQVKYDGFDGLTPNFDDGKATVPLDIMKPAVAGPNGQVLVIDGNHQAVAAMLAGAKSVPIEIVADMQDLDEATFWKTAEDKGWLYLNEMGGKPGALEDASYAKVENDPLRFTMSRIALKAKKIDGALVYEDSSRLDTRVWAKMKGPTVDFVEFKLADVLYRAGAADPKVKEGLESDDLATVARTARGALRDAAASGALDPDALGILLLDGGEELDALTQTIGAKIG
jgi:hypothetical protein